MYNLNEDKENNKKANKEITNLNDKNFIKILNNHIYFYSDINNEKILELNKNIHELNSIIIAKKEMWDIPDINIYLHINSYGGTIDAGIAGMDTILNSKVPVVTIVEGMCASAGTLLSMSGKHRTITKHSQMLIHQCSQWINGTYEYMKDEMKNSDKYMKTIKEFYEKYSKLPMKKLEEILKRDLHLTAKESLKYGLVDSIIIV